jgi:crotonobetainyl-CoA:carnitine CoA-transferase CaiB-like acyl-CoA transferase
VCLSASIQKMTERLLRAIGRPELITDPRYATNSERLKHADELDAIIGGFIGARTQGENVAYFEKYEVTIGPVYDIAQILEDPHVIERELVADYPDAEMGDFPMHQDPRLRDAGAIRTRPAYESTTARCSPKSASTAAYAASLGRVVCEGGSSPKGERNAARTPGVACSLYVPVNVEKYVDKAHSAAPTASCST